MSATANAKAFSRYFGGCPIITIPGRTYAVKQFFLEDALEATGFSVDIFPDLQKKEKRRDDDDGGRRGGGRSRGGRGRGGRGGRGRSTNDFRGSTSSEALLEYR